MRSARDGSRRNCFCNDHNNEINSNNWNNNNKSNI